MHLNNKNDMKDMTKNSFR